MVVVHQAQLRHSIGGTRTVIPGPHSFPTSSKYSALQNSYSALESLYLTLLVRCESAEYNCRLLQFELNTIKSQSLAAIQNTNVVPDSFGDQDSENVLRNSNNVLDSKDAQLKSEFSGNIIDFSKASNNNDDYSIHESPESEEPKRDILQEKSQDTEEGPPESFFVNMEIIKDDKKLGEPLHEYDRVPLESFEEQDGEHKTKNDDLSMLQEKISSLEFTLKSQTEKLQALVKEKDKGACIV
ncbi:hypothetical protein DI09_4p500 [Mitosporidium daphniae]|uniref:Uncharacterized protein n=1 Tax=Mitosporidium daphniae TaxID=1485682 RepID=A0A098VPI8_9MICR|nr:uncharacterized protein DI09_4p500 [Mitosporidium daphniae]KGG50967.1 hypothetical protein DI09_4p500 [Mitosporidium daphniae]|eukprot:XP_013237394.1 uncharacterized protein DI09_4p500 [Mitosporidium daphniae]